MLSECEMVTNPSGFFYAQTLDEVVVMVDEYDCDPAICEYHEVKTSGAFRWEHLPEWKMGEKDGCPELEEGGLDDWYRERGKTVIEGLTFCGGLHMGIGTYVYGETVKGWKQFPEYMEAVRRYHGFC
jgi:hypothetical protein